MTAAPARRDWTKIALIITISLCWGLNWPAVKTILAYLPPFTLRAVAFSAGAVLILGLSWFKGHRLWVTRAEIPALIGGGLCNVLIFNVCTAFGQLSMATSRAAVIAFTMPVWTTLLAIPLLGNKPNRRQVIGLVCGMGGLAVLLGPKGLDQGIGPLYMLGAALSWALGTIIMKRRVWASPALVITGWHYVLAAIPLVITASIFDSPAAISTFPPMVWLAFAWHIGLSICLAQVLWYGVVRRATVGEAAIGTLLIPVVGVIGSVVLLGDQFTLSLGLALTLILLGVGAVMVPGRRAKRLPQ
jgi:drug/metabolite transporter (DMT)-like permease